MYYLASAATLGTEEMAKVAAKQVHAYSLKGNPFSQHKHFEPGLCISASLPSLWHNALQVTAPSLLQPAEAYVHPLWLAPSAANDGAPDPKFPCSSIAFARLPLLHAAYTA